MLLLGILQSAKSIAFEAQFLVIAGGGGGGDGVFNALGGGGGAGGYRSSITGEQSGRGASAENVLGISLGRNYTVTVGAGGARATNGFDSVFGEIVSIAGGGGSNAGLNNQAGNGGSGGGRGWQGIRGLGTVGQGFDGGNFNSGGQGGGGGGAGSEPLTAFGGVGVASSVTGTSIVRAKGGASGTVDGESASVVNSGDGGNSPNSTRVGLPGGSGFVAIKYPDTFTITVGAGLTSNTPPAAGGFKVTTFTAGTDTIRFS